MKILLSPAKKLDFDSSYPNFDSTTPIFEEKTATLATKLKKLKPKDISKLMHLSPELSNLNFERFQKLGDKTNEKINAIFAFNGEVYSGLSARDFSQQDLRYANKNLRILSGLYGILKPSDLIEQYRLEMGTKLKVGRPNNLYEFWAEDIINLLNSEESEYIINLASLEYTKAAKLSKFQGKVLTINFKEFKNGDYKTIMVFAKKARGMMARWLIKNQVSEINSIKNFTEGGYLLNESLSKENEWVFTR